MLRNGPMQRSKYFFGRAAVGAKKIKLWNSFKAVRWQNDGNNLRCMHLVGPVAVWFRRHARRNDATVHRCTDPTGKRQNRRHQRANAIYHIWTEREWGNDVREKSWNKTDLQLRQVHLGCANDGQSKQLTLPRCPDKTWCGGHSATIEIKIKKLKSISSNANSNVTTRIQALGVQQL